MTNESENIKHVPKKWGYEKWIVNCEKYCGKLLVINKGHKCSWHFHKLKDEVFYVQSGIAEILYSHQDDIKKAKTKILKKGQRFHVPIGMRHQIIAITQIELFEFSTQHFDSDSYRINTGEK